MAPVRLAHITASPELTWGSAGLSGGFLPAAIFQDRSSSFRVSAAAPSPATSDMTVHTLELSEAMAGRYPSGFVCGWPVRFDRSECRRVGEGAHRLRELVWV